VAVVSLVLRHREHGEDPSGVRVGLSEPEDAPVAGREVSVSGRSQQVSRRAGPPLGIEESARLQSHQGLSNCRLGHAGDSQAVDQVRDGNPAADLPEVAAGERHDHRTRRAGPVRR
jgi:hypothetical protein